MKSSFLIIALLFLLNSENIFSQSYVPFLDNSEWIVQESGFSGNGNQNFNIYQGLDVVVGPYTYTKITDPLSGNEETFIREDVVNKKVYRLVNNVDQILFDFSLQISDSVTLGDGNTYTVDSITSIDVNGGTRRKFSLSNGVKGGVWVEGVGCLHNNPLKPFYEIPTDPVYTLICSFQNGINVYNRGIDMGLTPNSCTSSLNVETENYSNHQVTVSPNPFRTELNITSEINMENTTLLVSNSFGQIVKEINNINGQKTTLSRENLVSGVYFIRMLQNEKLVTQQKIIIMN